MLKLLIAQENIVRLFEEVVQFHASVQQNGGGSGLGLYCTLYNDAYIIISILFHFVYL